MKKGRAFFTLSILATSIVLVTYLSLRLTNNNKHQYIIRRLFELQPLNQSDDDCVKHIERYSPSYWETVHIDTLMGSEILHYFAWTNHSSCNLVHDFGGTMLKNPSGLDGQKAVCIDPSVAPQPKNCIVYSFGINNEWSFDEYMEMYGCEVFAFDPSMGMKHHNYSQHIHFYSWGLGYQDELLQDGWEMRSLSSIYNALADRHGNNTVIDYLKMDIESDEWEVLPNIIKSGMLSKVRQLGIEFHLPHYETVEEYRSRIQILRLLEITGMVRFDSKYNPWQIRNFTKLDIRGSASYEISWYNSNLLHTLR